MIGWIFSHKLLILFIAATTALGISTIVLSVENADLQTDLDECNDKNDPTAAPPQDTTTTQAPPEDLSKYRLPRHIIPKLYDLTLNPNLNDGLFAGEVTIAVDVLEESTEIRIHSKGLTILEATINGEQAAVEIDDKFELLILTLENGGIIPAAEATLNIKYSGDMKNRIVGLYTSTYIGQDGNPHAIATSKFEPTYARQAYPCFDEPNMKVKFTVHIVKLNNPNYIALSNMPSTGETPLPGNAGIMVDFQESIEMSTYLSCFIVCDFDYEEGIISVPGKTDVPLRVYATPAQVTKTVFARDVAQDVMFYFIQYFDIDYPLPKLDLIAIPDFVSGAMEHWGLVTFRETALLYDETMSSTANKQRIAEVVSHELAHSWFGNLVTMDWWEDLWLNEGFAAYIQFKGVQSVFPQWQMLDQFLIAELHPVLSLDATSASHPIVQTVLTPDEITAIFDTITYNKGASVLRMLEATIGENIFKQGVTNYLNAYAGGNAITQYLWDELQKLVPPSLDITEFMRTWTVQMGYPIVTVMENNGVYLLSQKRFLKDPEDVGEEPSPYGYTWTIPITYITNLNPDVSEVIWFNYADQTLSIPKPPGISWIKFNPKQVGYYRVNYNPAQPELWQSLADNIATMTTSDQTHLLEEAFSISESGDLPYQMPLELTKYLKNEIDYIPWSVASTKLSQLQKYLIGSLEYSNYLKYVSDLVTSAYESLTWNEEDDEGEEDHLKRRARIIILNLACSMGHAECLQEAQTRFRNWINNPTVPLSQNLRTIIYNHGMSSSGETEWNTVLELFKNEIDANEKLNLMRCLASVKDVWLLRRFLEMGWDTDVVRSQDYFTLLQYIALNPAGTAMVWDYVRENWPKLVERFTLNDRYLGRLIPSITSSFTTATKRYEIMDFFERYPEAGAGEAARVEAILNVGNNIKWVEKNLAIVEDWIRANSVN